MAIPDLIKMIPAVEGFNLKSIVLEQSETLLLPVVSLPSSACERIRYESSDSSIVRAENGTLIPVGEGEAMITAHCTGCPQSCFSVQIVPDDALRKLTIPLSTSMIEKEAFFGLCNVDAVILNEGLETIKEAAFDECCSLRRIEIPSTVNEIESNSFSGAVILCRKDSPAMEYALENGMEYICY